MTFFFRREPEPVDDFIDSSRTWVCPTGVYKIDAYLVGGGGVGNLGSPTYGSGGGALCIVRNYSVTPGQSYSLSVGGSCGSHSPCNGGTTSGFGCTATGGKRNNGGGGTASGGTENYNGSNGSGHTGGRPGGYGLDPQPPIYTDYQWSKSGFVAYNGTYGHGGSGNAGGDQPQWWGSPGAILIKYMV